MEVERVAHPCLFDSRRANNQLYEGIHIIRSFAINDDLCLLYEDPNFEYPSRAWRIHVLRT